MNTESEPLKSRRKPVQQRSRITQGAILDAFVRLLVEKGYVRLTIRDIALVAGVGIGTLYEYFPGKKSIAAHCIEQRFSDVGKRMEDWVRDVDGLPLQVVVEYLLDQLIKMHSLHSNEWSALIYLERLVSDKQSFEVLYHKIAQIWQQAFIVSSDSAAYSDKLPEVVHAAVYGVLYQTLMLSPEKLMYPAFSMQLKALVMGYLQIPSS